MNAVLIRDIKLPFTADDTDILNISEQKMKLVCGDTSQLHFRLYKKSVDARNKDNILCVSSVIAEGEKLSSLNDAKLKKINASKIELKGLEIKRGKEKIKGRPLVVGMGPAGLFCALLLAENGYAPIIIDRGDCIKDRIEKVNTFYQFGELDEDSNIQFGAGGAGTFSDGKLLTRISDEKCRFVLEKLYEFGAPEDILLNAKPHIGTDILRNIIDNMLSRISMLGGSVKYRCKLEKLFYDCSGLRAITNRGDLNPSVAVLALGHSAQDTFVSLMESGLSVAPKPFSVGVRIEHLQEDIDRALYGKYAGHPKLRHAEYALSHTKTERGVYTFCMCPGGEVVGASSDKGRIVVNGMSNFARDGKNANSALLVSVNCSDYGNTPKGAMEFQQNIERAAFEAGGNDYSAPIQTVGDFLNGKSGTEPYRIMPTYMRGKCKIAALDKILPDFVCKGLNIGISNFNKNISGFSASDAVLTGVETRTSSPVRILRDENLTAFGNDYIYPCGEGAGYAGGITSSAVDGIKVALEIMKRFAPPDN